METGDACGTMARTIASSAHDHAADRDTARVIEPFAQGYVSIEPGLDDYFIHFHISYPIYLFIYYKSLAALDSCGSRPKSLGGGSGNIYIYIYI